MARTLGERGSLAGVHPSTGKPMIEAAERYRALRQTMTPDQAQAALGTQLLGEAREDRRDRPSSLLARIGIWDEHQRRMAQDRERGRDRGRDRDLDLERCFRIRQEDGFHRDLRFVEERDGIPVVGIRLARFDPPGVGGNRLDGCRCFRNWRGCDSTGTRDPEMHQTKKGQQWYFGMKAHIGVDSRTKLIHSVESTAANVHDSTVLHDLLHGNERRVYGDQAYKSQRHRILEKAPLAKDFTNQRYRLKGVVNSVEQIKNRNKSKIRSRVEHVFACDQAPVRLHQGPLSWA